MEAYMKAAQNQSLRTIKSELEFLADCSVLTSQQVATILTQLPETASTTSAAPRAQALNSSTSATNAVANIARNTLSEKQAQIQPQQQPHQPPPPAYNTPTVLATGVALYAYTPSDAGDLALAPQDRVQVLENMNADWAMGRNERTGEKGIFPRSYISVTEDRPQPPGLPIRQNGSAYGNMPVDVAQGHEPVQNGDGHNKVNEQGKKFGKKLGNAAIFGAGATIGSNLVNSIF